MKRGRTGVEEVESPDPDHVPRRFAELGVPFAPTLDCLRRAHLASDYIDRTYPVTYKGTVVWGELNGAFRYMMISEVAWAIVNTENIPLIVSADGQVAITCVRGNDFTGTSNRVSTRRRRRRAGIRIIKANFQIEMVELLPMGGDPIALSATGRTWFLLYNRVVDAEAGIDVIRSELSLARSVNAAGTLIDWEERLVLPEIDMLGGGGPDGGEDVQSPPDIDVPIERLAG